MIGLVVDAQKLKAEMKRLENNFMKMCRMEPDEVHVKDVAAGKAEKSCIKQMKREEKGLSLIADISC